MPDDSLRNAAAEELDFLAQLKAQSQSLSARETRAARHLFANFPLAGLGTVAEFAEASGVSTATILRLIKRFGFANYAEFQTALKEHLETRLQSPLSRFEREDAAREDYLDAYFARLTGHMKQLRDGVDRATFENVCELLADPKRKVFFLGGRYSGSIAQYLADLLITMRPDVQVLAAAPEARVPQLLDIGRNSVILIFDVRRYQDDLLEFAHAAAARKAKIVVLTDPWLSPVARVASHVLTFPVTSPSVFDVLTCGVAVGEALLGAVARRLGEKGRDRITQLETLRRARPT